MLHISQVTRETPASAFFCDRFIMRRTLHLLDSIFSLMHHSMKGSEGSIYFPHFAPSKAEGQKGQGVGGCDIYIYGGH